MITAAKINKKYPRTEDNIIIKETIDSIEATIIMATKQKQNLITITLPQEVYKLAVEIESIITSNGYAVTLTQNFSGRTTMIISW